MKYKQIVKPEINPLILNTTIENWEFRPSITSVRGKYGVRFELTFSNGLKKQKQVGGFKTKKEANRAKEEILYQLSTGTYIPYRFTLQEFYDYWLYYYMLDKKIAYSTFVNYRNVIYNHLLKSISPRTYITNIESSDLIKFMDSIASNPLRCNAYAVISSSFKTAKELNIIAQNPAPYAVQTIRSKMRQKKRTETKRKTFSLQQLQNILLTCKKEEPNYYLLMLICATTGIRISEALGLQFENVDFPNRQLQIIGQKGRTIYGDGWESQMATSQLIQTKTYSSVRNVEIPQFVLDEIILAKNKYDYLNQNDVNFHYTPEKDWWDMGIVIYAPFRGKGYAVPALKLMLDHAFRVCGISRIHNDFEVARNEIAAWQTHRKAGFQKLGVKNGVLHMMITKEEYLSAARNVLVDDQINPNAEMA